MDIEFLTNIQGQSPLVGLVVSTGLIGLLTTVGYYLYEYLYSSLKQRLTSQISIASDDPLFEWMLDYLKENGLIKVGLTNLTATLKRKLKSQQWWQEKEDFSQDKGKPSIQFTPGAGYHFLTFKGVTIWIVQTEGQTLTVGYERKPVKQQVLNICCYGAKNIGILKQLCEEAMETNLSKEKGLTSIYVAHECYQTVISEMTLFLACFTLNAILLEMSITLTLEAIYVLGVDFSRGCGWKKVQTKIPRTMDSVILDRDYAQMIVNDLKNFQVSQKWYHERSVPYRRGYLLYGPPGSGKTSFINAISGHMNLNLCTLNLSGHLTDDLLNDLLSNTPLDSMILLEDVDSIFVERTSVEDKKQSQISFSGLLNALDGIRSSEGRILFMTTNHREKLDAALMRPGRIDLQINLENASSFQVKNLFLRFFDQKEKEAELFSKNIPEGKISMAALQGHCLKYKDNVDLALKNYQELFDYDKHFTKEMSIEEWLHRLSLDQYIWAFKDQNIQRIADLLLVDDSLLDAMNISNKFDRSTITQMIAGNQDKIQSFKWLNQSSARALLNSQLKDKKQLDNIMKNYVDNCMTEAQLRDIINPIQKRYLQTDIYDRFIKRLEYNEKFKNNQVKHKPVEKLLPQFDVIALLKMLNLENCIDKLKEDGCDEPCIFLERDASEYNELFELKKYSQKQTFAQSHKKIKEIYQNQDLIQINQFIEDLKKYK